MKNSYFKNNNKNLALRVLLNYDYFSIEKTFLARQKIKIIFYFLKYNICDVELEIMQFLHDKLAVLCRTSFYRIWEIK